MLHPGPSPIGRAWAHPTQSRAKAAETHDQRTDRTHMAHPRRRGRELGIGIVGCGGIVQQGHLPAYRKAGLRVVAVYDTNAGRARTSLRLRYPDGGRERRALVGMAGVDIVDIAVPPWVQPGVVSLAAVAGRHILCQKPLALELDQARLIVETAEAPGSCWR